MSLSRSFSLDEPSTIIPVSERGDIPQVVLETFTVIPSQPKYEIAPSGAIRPVGKNTELVRRYSHSVQAQGETVYYNINLWINGKRTKFCLNDLLFEVHGTRWVSHAYKRKVIPGSELTDD